MYPLTNLHATLAILQDEGILIVEKLLLWRDQSSMCHELCKALVVSDIIYSLLDTFFLNKIPFQAVNLQDIAVNPSCQFINTILKDINTNGT